MKQYKNVVEMMATGENRKPYKLTFDNQESAENYAKNHGFKIIEINPKKVETSYMIEKIRKQFGPYHTANLRQVAENVCINFHEYQENYTIYQMANCPYRGKDTITTSNISAETLQHLVAFQSLT